jgi:hypothetical protein
MRSELVSRNDVVIEMQHVRIDIGVDIELLLPIYNFHKAVPHRNITTRCDEHADVQPRQDSRKFEKYSRHAGHASPPSPRIPLINPNFILILVVDLTALLSDLLRTRRR